MIFLMKDEGAGLDRSSENAKPENFGVDMKGLMT